jgi:hypothetical protein
MNAASSIALSTKYPFAIFGLFGSMSISFRAARIVAANRMANFLSSVISLACESLGIEAIDEELTKVLAEANEKRAGKKKGETPR